MRASLLRPTRMSAAHTLFARKPSGASGIAHLLAKVPSGVSDKDGECGTNVERGLCIYYRRILRNFGRHEPQNISKRPCGNNDLIFKSQHSLDPSDAHQDNQRSFANRLNIKELAAGPSPAASYLATISRGLSHPFWSTIPPFRFSTFPTPSHTRACPS